jgi:hypothetical protein
MKPTFLAAFLLCTASAFAQGTIRFDWVDSYNRPGSSPFQASFTLDASVVHPNSEPWPRSDPGNDHALTSGITITSPDHTFVNPLATWPPGSLGTHFDSSGRLYLNLDGEDGDFRVGVFLDPDNWGGKTMIESWSPGGVYYEALGTWQQTVIPEPSCAALLGLGLLALYVKRAASSSSL